MKWSKDTIKTVSDVIEAQYDLGDIHVIMICTDDEILQITPYESNDDLVKALDIHKDKKVCLVNIQKFWKTIANNHLKTVVEYILSCDVSKLNKQDAENFIYNTRKIMTQLFDIEDMVQNLIYDSQLGEYDFSKEIKEEVLKVIHRPFEKG